MGNGWGLSFQEETSYTYTLTLYYSRISILYKKNKNKNVIPLNPFIYIWPENKEKQKGIKFSMHIKGVFFLKKKKNW